MTWPSAGVALAAAYGAAGEAGGTSWAFESAAAIAKTKQEPRTLSVFLMGPSFLKTQELMSFVIAAAIGLAWTLGGTFATHT